MMDQGALKSFQVCETSTPEQLGYMVCTTVTNKFNDQDAGQTNEPRTSLHSRKEQKRRLQIKTCCQHLCQLLPFVNGSLDTATTLELTVKYISYLKNILPPHILSQVMERVEKNSNSPSSNTQRKTTVLKNTTKKTRQAAKKSNHDRYLRRSCHQRILKKEVFPVIIISHPPPVLIPVDPQTIIRTSPTLLDKSAVPWGQMLPVSQNQSVANPSHCVKNNWTNPTPTENTSLILNPIVLPQISKGPTLDQTLWDGTFQDADPVAFQPLTFDQLYDPPTQIDKSNLVMLSEHTEPPVVNPTPSVPAEDFINQLLTSPAKFQSASSSWDELIPGSKTPPGSEALCDSRLFPENDFGITSPLTDPRWDAVSPFWLDLFCSDGLCFTDANPPFKPGIDLL